MSIKPGDKVWLAEKGERKVGNRPCRCIDNGGWGSSSCPICHGSGNVYGAYTIEPWVSGPHTVVRVTTNETVNGSSVSYIVSRPNSGYPIHADLVFLTEAEAKEYAGCSK